MRPAPIRKSEAFTRVELLVVIVVGFVLLGLFFPFLIPPRATAPASRITCVKNLKQIGTTYRLWSNDHNDRFPAAESLADGGWSDLLEKPNEGYMCWINYAVMSNELGNFTKILVCPSDERKPADGFSNFVSNLHLSYLVGLTTDAGYPQSLLAGDRNLGSGTAPDRKYGFSPESGQGNDVAIQTNSQAGPVCWSLKMHSLGNKIGTGNILLGDGSVQQCTSDYFRKTWQPHFEPTINWPGGHVPSSPSIRVLFP